MYRRLFLFISFVVLYRVGLCQENVTTVGFQLKVMVPTKFVDTGGGESTNLWLSSVAEAKSGYSMGMVIRRGFTKSISLETGINYLKRNFNVKLQDNDSLTSSEMDYSFIGYQIPVKGLVYTRLTDKVWMNASGGLGLNFMPSNVETSDGRFAQTTFRTGTVRWFNLSMMANYGFEWRTKKDGFFYLGASYDRPFQDLAFVRTRMRRASGEQLFTDEFFTGAYLTIDFRYFFHEDPERKKKMKKKGR